MNTASDASDPSDSLPQVRSVPPSQPFIWISKGWDDLLHHRGGSLAYGALMSILGGLTLMYQRHPLFLAVAISALMLVGPIMAAGLCELSRRRSRGARLHATPSTLAQHLRTPPPRTRRNHWERPANGTGRLLSCFDEVLVSFGGRKPNVLCFVFTSSKKPIR